MGRVLVLACAAVALAAATGTAGAQPSAGQARSWAEPEIRTVVTAGVMGPSVADFRPQDPLTIEELAEISVALGASPPSFSDPDRLVTMRELDSRLVGAAGLLPAARHVRAAAIAAGLHPTPWLGTETVARLLGLRVNHLRARERLELQLSQPATRAEAARTP